MDREVFEDIETKLDYHFRNRDLLQQAFIRRSYAKENGGEDNEKLEFIGDKVLDFIVIKILVEKYGFFLNECDDFDSKRDYNEFACEYRENQLTEIKKRLVKRETLAAQIDFWGFSDYLIMGKGDVRNHIDEVASVKEDLFEAIIGAVALDTNWNIAVLQDVVELMLNPESYISSEEDNYVGLIQDFCFREYDAEPQYEYKTERSTFFVSERYIRSENIPSFWRGMPAGHYCELTLGDYYYIFRGYGSSKNKARMDAASLAYKHLREKGLLYSIRDEIENPNKNEAIGQLEILARRGYFSLPTYEFAEEHDKDGNPVWTCECHIEEVECYFDAQSSAKKEAKKQAAFEMLQFVLEAE